MRGALLALTVLCSLRGSLCLYQGEELALPEAELAFDDLQDPSASTSGPGVKGRDGCRTPMVWETTENGGFVQPTHPWLPVDARHQPLAVTCQEASSDSPLNRIRQLLKQLRNSELLRQGKQSLINLPLL
ncbi:alpha-glucosidase, partial [Billgrantia gudaonensis]